MLAKTVTVVGCVSVGLAVKKFLFSHVELPLAKDHNSYEKYSQKFTSRLNKLKEQYPNKIWPNKAQNEEQSEGVQATKLTEEVDSINFHNLTEAFVTSFKKQQTKGEIPGHFDKELADLLTRWRKFLHQGEAKRRSGRAAGRFQDSLNESFQDDASEELEESHQRANSEDLKSTLYKFLSLFRKLVLQEAVNVTFLEDALKTIETVIENAMIDGMFNNVTFYESLLIIACCKILCAATLNENYSSVIRSNKKLMALIATWTNSEYAFLNMIGRKCQWNLANQNMLIPDGMFIWESNPSMEFTFDKTGNTLDVIWLHGLAGSAFYTWRQHGSRVEKFLTCWPVDWLGKDLPNNIRFIFLDYDTIDNPADQKDCESLGRFLLHKLNSSKILSPDNPKVFIGHSMGGLLLKQIVVLDNKESNSNENGSVLKNISGFLFLSTPHFGSSITNKVAQLPAKWTKCGKFLDQIGDKGFCFRLNSEFTKTVLKLYSQREVEILSVAESLPTNYGYGITLMVVPLYSAYPLFGKCRILKADHIRTSKAVDRNDPLYELVKDFVLLNVPPEKFRKYSFADNNDNFNSNHLFNFMSFE